MSVPPGWAGRGRTGGIWEELGPLPQAPFPSPQASPEFRLHLRNLHPQLGSTVVFEHGLGQLLQKRILRAHQLRRERTRQVETRAGRLSGEPGALNPP